MNPELVGLRLALEIAFAMFSTGSVNVQTLSFGLPAESW